MEKLQRFENVISRITDRIFVSGCLPTSDLSKLKACGITHIVNCARGQCSNHFAEQDSYPIKYLDYYFGDSSTTDVQSFFLEALNFYYIAIKENDDNRILFHCVQGVSRSCTFAVALLMHQRRMRFSDAMAFVKSGRPVSNPNTSFQAQLLGWQRKLQYRYSSGPANSSVDSTCLTSDDHLSASSSYPFRKQHSPRSLLYQVKSDALSDRRYMTKLLIQPNGTPISPNTMALDSSHVYIIQFDGKMKGDLNSESTPSFTCEEEELARVYIWIGSQCKERMETVEAARTSAHLMMKFELLHPDTSTDFREEEEGVESELFKKIVPSVDKMTGFSGEENQLEFGLCGAAVLEDTAKLDSAVAASRESSSSSALMPPLPPSSQQLQNKTKKVVSGESVTSAPKLYGKDGEKWEEFVGFEEDDLSSDSIRVLVLNSVDKKCCYIWKGKSCEVSEGELKSFCKTCPGVRENFTIVFENEGQESEAFWDIFDEGI
eukprot:g4362.t1